MNINEFLQPYTTILIPRIQRDYAQGRQDNRTKGIRENLLSDVFSGNRISFNMIFGECNEKKEFIPIDGQQRLTFLFLLALYGLKTGKCEDIGIAKLHYATRESASEFWDFITKLNWPVLTDQKISSWCKNQCGYQWYWNQDPTVESMLVVLDDIHRFAQKPNAVFPDLDKIDFQCHDMKVSGLNETLYLKMNSRGKHLNAFERIKSALDGIVADYSNALDAKSFNDYDWGNGTSAVKRSKNFSEKWSYCMERQWSDWFWDEQSASFDGTLLKLILAYTYVFISCREDARSSKNIRSEISEFIGLSSSEILSDTLPITPQVSHIKKAYMKENSVTGELEEVQDLKKSFFEGLAMLLSRLTASEGSFNPSWDKKGKVDFRDPQLKYENKTLGILASLIYFRGGRYIGKDFRLWLRFCWNMVQNTVEDDESLKRFSRNIRRYYSCGSTHILIWLTSVYANHGATSEQLRGQLEEEILKATILQPLCRGFHTDLTDAVLSAESHPLLRGRIKPLLLDKEGRLSFESFLNKWSNYQTLFTKSGEVINKVKFIEAYIKSAETQKAMSYSHDSSWSVFRVSTAAVRDKFNDKDYNSVWPNLFAVPLGEHRFVDDNKNLTSEINIRKQLLTPKFIEKILEKWPKENGSPRINWYYDSYYLYPSGAKGEWNFIMLDWYDSEPNDWNMRVVLLLNELENSGELKVENEALFNNSSLKAYHSFWIGKDIIFNYQEYEFVFSSKDYEIYIKSDNPTPTKKSVRGISSCMDFIEKMKSLIAEAQCDNTASESIE